MTNSAVASAATVTDNALAFSTRASRPATKTAVMTMRILPVACTRLTATPAMPSAARNSASEIPICQP
jgi:hypothetical protein